jgi:hypothetical protein
VIKNLVESNGNTDDDDDYVVVEDDDNDKSKSTGKVEKKSKNSGTTWKLKMMIVYIGAV